MKFDKKFLIAQIRLIVGTNVSKQDIMDAFKNDENDLLPLTTTAAGKKEHARLVELSKEITEHFEDLIDGLIEEGVLKRDGLISERDYKTQIELLKIRTSKILSDVRFDRMYGVKKKKRILHEINALDNHSKTGFHDLYIKCQLYQILLDNLPLYADTKLFNNALAESDDFFTDVDKFFVELLFNPVLEEESGYTFSEIIEYFDEIDKDDLSNYLFWENFSQELKALQQSIKQYIHWFDANEHQLGEHDSLISYRDTLPLDEDVNMDCMKDFYLVSAGYCGTSGLFPCVAIIAIIKEQKYSVQPKVVISHDAFGIRERLKKIENAYPGSEIDYYFFGGLAVNLKEYLSIITDNTFSIKDIRLCTPIDATLSCCIGLKHYSPEVLYTSTIYSPTIYQSVDVMGDHVQMHQTNKRTSDVLDSDFIENSLPKRQKVLFFDEQPDRTEVQNPEQASNMTSAPRI